MFQYTPLACHAVTSLAGLVSLVNYCRKKRGFRVVSNLSPKDESSLLAYIAGQPVPEGPLQEPHQGHGLRRQCRVRIRTHRPLSKLQEPRALRGLVEVDMAWLSDQESTIVRYQLPRSEINRAI